MSTLLHAALLVAAGCAFVVPELIHAGWLSPDPLLSAEPRDPGARHTPDTLEHG